MKKYYYPVLMAVTYSFLPQHLFANKQNVYLQNPLSNIDKLETLLGKIIEIILTIGVPVLVLAFVWTGFKYVAARGNSAELEKAHLALKYTLIGAVFILGSLTIATAISGTLDQILRV